MPRTENHPFLGAFDSVAAKWKKNRRKRPSQSSGWEASDIGTWPSIPHPEISPRKKTRHPRQTKVHRVRVQSGYGGPTRESSDASPEKLSDRGARRF